MLAARWTVRRRRGGTTMTRVTHAVLVATLLTVPVLVERAYAHHGAGLYDMRKNVELEGTITRVDFVNPHTYVYFNVVGSDGKVIAMKCETRGATVLRRSGWSPEMFVKGTAIKLWGHPHSEDPTARNLDTMTLGSKPTLERYQQLSDAKSVDRTKRPFRLANGKPNLVGEWAQEQQVLATPPGGRAGLVPISKAADIRAGKLPMPAGVPGWFPPPVKLTAAGEAAAAALVREPAALLSAHQHPVRLGVRRRDRPHHAEYECHQDGIWRRSDPVRADEHDRAPGEHQAEPRRTFNWTLGRRYARRRHSRLPAWQPGRQPPSQRQAPRRRALHVESHNPRADPRHRRRRSRLLRGQVRGYR